MTSEETLVGEPIMAGFLTRHSSLVTRNSNYLRLPPTRHNNGSIPRGGRGDWVNFITRWGEAKNRD